MKRITKDAFDRFREEMGAEYVDDLLAKFGLGPNYVAPEKQLFKCSSCGGENAYWHEFGADCDAGQNYMALYCPDCGHEDENPKKSKMKTLEQLQKEFGARVCTLNTGAAGLRGGLRFEVREVPGDAPVFDFVGSDGTVDRYNEVIQPAAWGDMKNFKANPVVPDCHDYSSIARILGRALSVEVRDGRLCNRVEFCLDNPMGALAYKMTKGGFIKSQSVGFIPEDWTTGNGKDQPFRTYTKCELLEISLVVVPANPGATIGLALKSGAIQKSDLSAAADFLSEFRSKQTPGATGGASGAGVHDAHLLNLARTLGGKSGGK